MWDPSSPRRTEPRPQADAATAERIFDLRATNPTPLVPARSGSPGLSAERYVDELRGGGLCGFRPPVVARRRRRTGVSGEGLDYGEIGAGLEGCGDEGSPRSCGEQWAIRAFRVRLRSRAINHRRAPRGHRRSAPGCPCRGFGRRPLRDRGPQGAQRPFPSAGDHTRTSVRRPRRPGRSRGVKTAGSPGIDR